jgi:signal transduction histidine kinase/AraC-like DNA-binding protein
MNNPLVFLKCYLIGPASVLSLPLVSLILDIANVIVYSGSLLVIVSALYFVRRWAIRKKESQSNQEKKEAEKKREEIRGMHELDQMKIEFFSNVNHEFRTLLSLILLPIENLIKSNTEPEQQQQLLMIRRNGKRLLNTVNQLLDFNGIEMEETKLNLATSNIIKFIKDTCLSFTDMAEQNRITFLFDSEVIALNANFDHDKIERVLFNLLSNSFKFTSPGGYISVLVSLAKNERGLPDERLLEIQVYDTGIGIPKEKQEKIFERFFRDDLPKNFLNHGSGIGLPISRKFIKMHNGEINVESEPGNGSCFTIRIPISVSCENCDPVHDADQKGLYNNSIPSQKYQKQEFDKKPVVLLIDDNDDLRYYLKDNLKYAFHIIESANGKDGWQKTLLLRPDLIVSNITMSGMNGVDLCKKIRQDSRTAHIPIILLTSLVAEEDQLAASAHGANYYITKPFHFEVLLAKINGLLLMQQALKKTYQNQVSFQEDGVALVSDDEKFLKRALNCIEKNMADPFFSVEQFSKIMLLSRVSLYKKLLRLTGKTPIECIRTVRLKRAVQLLGKNNLSVAYIASQVGFNDPTYFAKVFKEEYGKLPSQYVKELLESRKQPLSGF